MVDIPHNKRPTDMDYQDIIDPHVHFFALEKGNYQWLKSTQPPFWPDKHLIQKNVSDADLTLCSALRLNGVVHIEAGFDNEYPERELAYLNDTVKRVSHKAIAYLDITLEPTLFSEKIRQYQTHGNFVGIRDITEGEDAQRLHHSNVVKNLAFLAHEGLIFEAQFEIAQLATTQTLRAYCVALPNLKCVINHCGLVTPDTFASWQLALHILKGLDNLWVKISGFEMAQRQFNAKWVQTVTDALLQTINSEHLMFASNFPLCLLSQPYHQLWQLYSELTLPDHAWTLMGYHNAQRLYQLA